MSTAPGATELPQLDPTWTTDDFLPLQGKPQKARDSNDSGKTSSLSTTSDNADPLPAANGQQDPLLAAIGQEHQLPAAIGQQHRPITVCAATNTSVDYVESEDEDSLTELRVPVPTRSAEIQTDEDISEVSCLVPKFSNE